MDNHLLKLVKTRARALRPSQKVMTVIACGLAMIGCAEQPLKPITTQELTTEFTQLIEESAVPGLGIAFVQDGQVIYKNGFGYQNLEAQTPYTVDTQQALGSVSKTFIGAAIAKALSLDLFTLDTPINRILPNPIEHPHRTNGEITLRHLVNHTSSIVDDNDSYSSTYYVSSKTDSSIDLNSPMGQLYRELNVKVTDTPRTLEELVNAYFYPQGDLYASTNFADTQPGEVVEYSNLAATLAAYVVEVASGMSYETFLQIHILDPLSMHATGFAGTEVSPSQHASSYIDDVPLPFYRLESFPDGGLRSTINDLSLYLLDMMEGQKGQSDVLFAPSVYNTLFTKQGEFSLFWSASGQGSFSHTGGDPGISTLMGFGPNIKGGVVLIMNIDSEAGGNEGFIDDLWAQKIGPLAKRYLHTAPSAR